MMTRFGWSLVNVVAQLLEPEEHEAVQGDLEEAGESAGRALLDVLGLVLRRQAVLWKSWRPWLAALGLAFPGALVLMGLSLALSQNSQLDGWFIASHGFLDRHRVWLLASDFSLLISLSWSSGFAVGSISRRTLWVSAVVCCLPCLFCLARFCHNPSLSRLCLLLFLIPGIWGAWRGSRIARIDLSWALVLAAVILLTVPAWHSGRQFFLSCAFTLPACYLIATAHKPIWLFRRKGNGE